VTKEEQDQAKATIFKNMDLFIGQVVDSLDQDSLLLVVVPFPSKEDAVAGKKLTPVMAYSRSISKGILTSATTKRDGIITNTDLAAEIACFFGLEKDFSMIGHDLIYKSHRQPLQFLNDINQITVFNYRFRPKIISAFISYIIVVLLLCVICVNHRPNYLSYLRPFFDVDNACTYGIFAATSVWCFRSFRFCFCHCAFNCCAEFFYELFIQR